MKLLQRRARDPLTCLVNWRGGPEAWIEIRARGRTYRFPGYVSIAEVVLELNLNR